MRRGVVVMMRQEMMDDKGSAQVFGKKSEFDEVEFDEEGHMARGR